MNIKEKGHSSYDNQCYLCVKFAKMIEFLTRDNLIMIGHYSEFGIKLRKPIWKNHIRNILVNK